jgi:hypothetical protein
MHGSHQPRQIPRNIARLIAAGLCFILPTACVSTWSELPRTERTRGTVAVSPATLYYEIADVQGLFGGGEALREALRQHAPFARIEPLSEPPQRGLYCRVEAERRSPNVASGIAAYLSYAFLFTSPFWSTEGYTIRYHVYVDGLERKIFEYDITRKSFFWIVALPVTWVSLLTPSERDAFEATVHQFYAEATPYFRGELAWVR